MPPRILSLQDLGWNAGFEAFSAAADTTSQPARVVSVYSARVEVWLAGTSERRMVALRGRALRDAPAGGIAVGDWAMVAPVTKGATEVVVERILPRSSAFLRQAAGERSEPQAIAANIDYVFIVTSVDGDASQKRLERYLVAIEGSGAKAVIVMTKVDRVIDTEPARMMAAALAPVVMTSARTGFGIRELREHVPSGTTAALVGSSGVGKSALINALLGHSAQGEGAVRAYDNRGRHTTTKRSLFALPPGGGLIIDTPGMRELKPWHAGAESQNDSETRAFEDIEMLISNCKYTNCRHAGEPGCKVQSALQSGELSAERFASWEKHKREREENQTKQDNFAALQAKRRLRRAPPFT